MHGHVGSPGASNAAVKGRNVVPTGDPLAWMLGLVTAYQRRRYALMDALEAKRW